jgi:hypothetical protein
VTGPSPYTPSDPGSTVYLPLEPYATVDDVVACTNLDLTDDFNLSVFEQALMWASRRVFSATGNQFIGSMQSTIRPCRIECPRPQFDRYRSSLTDLYGRYPGDTPMLAHWFAETAYLFGCWPCACGAPGWQCQCVPHDVLPLPWLPVRSVDSVKVDGAFLTAGVDYYFVPGSSMLARLGGVPWPALLNVDQTLPLTSVGTWAVTFTHGLDIPPEARQLVAAYACQLTKRALGLKCELTDDVAVISRPGVTFGQGAAGRARSTPAIVEFELRSRGLTGYQPLDDWILNLTGGHATERPRLVTGRPRTTSLLGSN